MQNYRRQLHKKSLDMFYNSVGFVICEGSVPYFL